MSDETARAQLKAKLEADQRRINASEPPAKTEPQPLTPEQSFAADEQSS